MIDPRLLRDDPDRIRAAQRRRREPDAIVDELRAADEARRRAIAGYETLRAEQKQLGKQVARATGGDRDAVLAQTKELAARVKTAVAEQTEAEQAYVRLMATLPNVADERAPAGGEDDYVVLETHGTIRDFEAEGLTARDHVEIGTMLKAIDVERGVKVSGARFYFLTGVGAMLELALVQAAMQRAESWGFTPVVPPALVKPRAMDGSGFLGQAAVDVYHLEKDDLYLVGTSEVPLAAYHSDEILDKGSLPRRYAAFSPCFRREAGSYGKDTRGIIRVHWFDKVEMFAYTTVEESYEEHERLLGFEREWLTELELPFRVIDVAAGDLGMSAVRKFDCEAWLPSQQRHLELTSTSNCTDFQARRLDTRVRTETAAGSRTEAAATLNGTLCAIPRTIVAILENHQQADGSVRVPLALQPYLQGRDVLKPAGSGE